MQQKQIYKMKQVLIHQILQKKTDLDILKSDVDKLDIDKLKNVPRNLNDLKSKLVTVPVDFSKLSDAVKIMLLEVYIMLTSNALKETYLILLT